MEAQSASTVHSGAASLAGAASRSLAEIQRDGDEKEARKHTANNLGQAAKGTASIGVLRKAAQEAQIKTLAALDQATSGERFLGKSLIPGENLLPIVRTVFTLALEEILP